MCSLLTQPEGADLPVASGKLPRSVRAICEKAMAADPKARYQSAAEMTADLAHYVNGAPVSAYSENLFERTCRIYGRHNTAVALVLVYLFMRFPFILLPRR